MARVRLERLTKRFGRVVAAREVSLDIADGEFFSFLGPPGCGKTVITRMVARFGTLLRQDFRIASAVSSLLVYTTLLALFGMTLARRR